jgi:hypothetical protein
MQHLGWTAHLMSSSIVPIWIGVRDSDNKGFERQTRCGISNRLIDFGIALRCKPRSHHTIAGTSMHGIH